MSFPERIRYGATELRSFYNRNLFMALGVSIALHLALVGLYLTSVDEVVAHSDFTPRDSIVLRKYVVDPPTPHVERPKRPTGPHTSVPDVLSAPPVLPPIGDGALGSSARSGNPKPVDDSLLKPEDGKFANTENIASSDPNGKGNGGGPNGSNEGVGTPREQVGGGESRPAEKPVEEIPNEFAEPDVKLPDVDLAELSARAEYPRMARENGIEGRVTVKVLIGEDGRPLRVAIENGAAAVLDSAAIRAVRATVFKPATLNGNPVRAWLFLPVNFTLDDQK